MKFSIVITYFPEDKRAEILDSISQMDYPKKEYEILDLPGPGSPSIYRNKGAVKAKGKIVVYLDDDAMVDKNLLKNADSFFKEHPEMDMVGGPQVTPVEDKGFARISGYALSSIFGAWDVASRYTERKMTLNADEKHLTTANLFCKKKVTDKIKFDEKLFPGEDTKFFQEVKKAGFEVGYNPKMIVHHRRRPTIRKFIKQIFLYGKVRPTLEKFSSTLRKPFFLIPSLFFIYVLAFLISAVLQLSIATNFWFMFPLIAYIVLDLMFSIYESVKNVSFWGLIFLPFIFPMIHLSYGAGMILGFLNKIF